MAAQDRELIVVIDSWNQTKGIGTFTEASLADFIGTSRRSINRRLQRLELWGVIERSRSAGWNKPASITINRQCIPDDWKSILRLAYEFE